MIRPLWSPCENLLGLLELASLHIADKRWTYVVTTLSVALDLARKLAGEMPPPAPVLCCPDCGSRDAECNDCASRFALSEKAG